MTAYNVISPGALVAGQPEDISVVLANLNAIATVLNGGVDNSNMAPNAALALSKLAGFPNDPSLYARGDGTWGVPGSGASGIVPAGVVASFVGTNAPSGWLFCDGAAVSRTTYSGLFAVIGTGYGAGDGTNTFNVPDLKGRVPVGKGANADVSALGASEGLGEASRSPKHNHTNALAFNGANANTGTESADHTHSGTTSGSGHNYREGGGGTQWSDYNGAFTFAASDHTHSFTTGGRSAAHTHNYTPSGTISGTVGPGGARPTDSEAFLVVNYLIKT